MTTNGESVVMGEQVPLSYLKLADKLNELQKLKQREKELPILNREEFFEVARNLDCQKDSIEDDEIELATSFLHRTGLLILLISISNSTPVLIVGKFRPDFFLTSFQCLLRHSTKDDVSCGVLSRKCYGSPLAMPE